jgi:hypothetical protein
LIIVSLAFGACCLQMERSYSRMAKSFDEHTIRIQRQTMEFHDATSSHFKEPLVEPIADERSTHTSH